MKEPVIPISAIEGIRDQARQEVVTFFATALSGASDKFKQL
jgi:hypothetical protein